MVELWHFTCRHAAQRIADADMVLKPHAQPTLGGMELIWFTHVAGASSRSLGLSSHTLKCDRRERMFRVLEPEKAFAWNEVRAVLPLSGVRLLEAAHGTMPAFWWVAQEPVRVEAVAT